MNTWSNKTKKLVCIFVMVLCVAGTCTTALAAANSKNEEANSSNGWVHFNVACSKQVNGWTNYRHVELAADEYQVGLDVVNGEGFEMDHTIYDQHGRRCGNEWERSFEDNQSHPFPMRCKENGDIYRLICGRPNPWDVQILTFRGDWIL